MRKVLLFLFFGFLAIYGKSQTPDLVFMEYFIDADPGRGLGTSVAFAQAPALDISFTIPTASISIGFHVLTVRTQDENSNWSIIESKPFYVGFSSNSIQNNISALEYFIDSDPGRGSGTAISITPAAIQNLVHNVPTGTLSEGFHLLTIRAQDEQGVWSLSESMVFFVSQSTSTSANQIDKLEYFIDTDPGRGAGVDIPIAASSNLDIISNVPTGSLAEGFHILTIRARDERGLWSLSESKAFHVSQSTTNSPNQIDKLEYFIDTDPGRGAGVDIPVTASTNLDIISNVPTGSLNEGFHIITMRARDERGLWSLSESKAFYVSQSTTNTPNIIDKLEYFIGADPGRGAGVDIPITASTDLNVLANIPTGSLADGFHRLTVRARDVNSIWSLSESKPFYITSAKLTSNNEITSFEYYFNTDPGHGSGFSIPVSPNDTIKIISDIDISGLSKGFHTFFLRAQDDQGQWSLVESKPFYVDEQRKIVAYEYAIDVDPGIGNANYQSITPIDSAALILYVDTAPLVLGAHTLYMRIKDEFDFWSRTEAINFTVCDGATAFIVADTVCLGSPTLLQDLSTNVVAGDVFSWDFDGDGLEDDNTGGDKSFVYPGPGTYFANVTIDRSGCIGHDTVAVVVADIPIPNAGLDQVLCNTSTNLTANPLQVNETGAWSISSGNGVIVDNQDPGTMINSISSNSVELVWTLTNTLAGCVDMDTVLITPNLPIGATRSTENVEIGQNVNSDVQSSATVNSIDVLTSTIITAPLFGSAIIENDGSISYTPDLDAASLDSLYYRVTNQCNNFAENYIVYNVSNAPPVISTTNLSLADNSTSINIDLTTLLSDPNNNIDLASLIIVSQPVSGAVASIDNNGILTIDYSNVTFSGDDAFEIQVCDLLGACVVRLITIANVQVGAENPPLIVFNAVSPNGDGYNDFLFIENIEAYPDNVVVIVNRWGNEVEKIQGYNNTNVVFNNNSLPSGTYYYHILPGISELEPVTGHFILKTDQ